MTAISRFEHYLLQLEKLLQQAQHEHNPALWLFQNNARTTLFMLEGLSKLYAGLHNKKKFSKLKDNFKSLEDTLGAIDHYQQAAKDLAEIPGMPEPVIAYLQAQAREKIQSLNEILTENKWIGEQANKIKKIRSKLVEAEWLEGKKEVKKIESFYKESIEEIIAFWSKAGFRFKEMEEQVHEMRRDLRWLSIYPHALLGLIQLKDSGIVNFNTDKYLTPEIIYSPFNKFPEKADITYLLLLEKKYFLSLSWLIAKMGFLKDNGLRILALTEAVQQTENLSHQTALNKSMSYLNASPDLIERILDEATAVCRLFFQEKNLENIVAGVSES